MTSVMLACPGFRLRTASARGRARERLVAVRRARKERASDHAANPALERQALTKASEAVGFGIVPATEGGRKASAPAPIVQKGSDLALLPGAGEGLIWMLNQQNIQTMSDLAKADPGQLSSAIGPVGQLLDIEAWVNHARQIG